VFSRTPDLRLAAHEAAHVVQQRKGHAPDDGIDMPDDELERHADAVADHVVAGQSAATARQPSRPRRAGDRDPAGQQGQEQRSRRTDQSRVRQQVRRKHYPRDCRPHRRHQHSAAACTRALDNARRGSPVDRIGDPERGPDGTRKQAVEIAVATAFDMPLITSIQRMGTRLCVQLDLHGGIKPRGDQLVASCPLDGVLADVLVKPAVTNCSPKKKGAADDTGGAPFAKGVRGIEWEWQGKYDANLWNWIKVRLPKDATAEDVAQAPLHGNGNTHSEQAYRIAVDVLVSRNRLACLLYLRGVVEDVTMRDATAFMERLERPRDGPAWQASGERRAQVEACLYRALTEEELATAGSLDELTTAHLAVVRRLARFHRFAGFMYLEAVVAGTTLAAALDVMDRVSQIDRSGNRRP
jgi:hypothetical protein